MIEDLKQWALANGWFLGRMSSMSDVWQERAKEGHGYPEGPRLFEKWERERENQRTGNVCEKCSYLDLEHDYMDGEKQKKWPMRCFNCRFWSHRALSADSKRSVVVKGEAYYIETDLPKDVPSHCAGYGGSRFTITFLDNRTVITRNLWSQGTIPPYFRDVLPDNASSLTSS